MSQKAHFLWEKGKKEDAVEALKEAVEKNPEERLYERLATMLSNLDNFDEAEEFAKKLVELDDKKAESYLTLARTQRLQDKPEKLEDARKSCNKAIQMEPANDEYEHGYKEKAEKTLIYARNNFDEAAGRNPLIPWPYIGEAFVYRAMRQNSKARKSFGEGIDAYLRRLYGKYYYNAEQFKEPIEELEEGDLSESEDGLKNCRKLGFHLLATKKLEKAEIYLKKAINGDLGDVRTLLAYADSIRMQGDGLRGDEAMQFYREAEKLAIKESADEDESYALFGQAILYFEKGHSNKDIELVKRAIKLHPEEAIFQLFLGMSHDRNSEHIRANRAFNKFNKTKSNRAELRDFVSKRETVSTPLIMSKRALKSGSRTVLGIIFTLSLGALLRHGYDIITDTDDDTKKAAEPEETEDNSTN